MRRMLYLVLMLCLSIFVVACGDEKEKDKNGGEESVCGDGVCDPDEDADSCPEDCDGSNEGVCGDGVCDDDETIDSCPEDCDDGNNESVCGDGVCDPDEDTDSCPEDCDGSNEGVCGDGVCDDDETIDSCPEDCDDGSNEGVCGDGVCDPDEDTDSCPEDCDGSNAGVCGDGVCDDDETIDSCPEDCDDGGSAEKTCVAVYDLAATMEITGTPLGMGDETAEDLPGQLALRYTEDADNAEAPADGSVVEVLHWFIRNEIVVDGPVLVTTIVNAFTPTCNGETDLADKTDIPDTCDFDDVRDTEVRASGVYDADAQELAWDACDVPDEYYDDPAGGGYTPEHSATGPGCLNDYYSQGNVNCDGALCSMGQLDEGDNIQDGVWNQPLEAFSLSADGSTVELARTRTPNSQPSSTFFSFEGTRTSVNCE